MKEEVNSWLAKARQDIQNVELILKHEGGLYDTVCFHSQQYIEKLLKAYLIKNSFEVGKTHNLIFLLKQCSESDTKFLNWKDQCEKLNAYAIHYRYPGEDADKDDALDSYHLAVDLAKFILEKLEA